MDNSYSYLDLLWYLMVYSLLGWSLEVFLYAVTSRKFVNQGLLNLPFSIPAGLTSVTVMLVLPTMEGGFLPHFLMTLAIQRIIWNISSHFVRRVSGAEPPASTAAPLTTVLGSAAVAMVYYITYLLIHPILLTIFTLLPQWLKDLGAILFVVSIALDYICVRHTLRTQRLSPTTVRHLAGTQRLADRMTDAVWSRLSRTYPGIGTEEEPDPVFARGLCFDKLFWIFLISSVLGAGIEMVFCRVTGGIWMNRSSLLYGPFSVVWGIGAVVLTVVLRRLRGKPDRSVFLAGCLVGGVYEYLCSVFTEYIFGTVFWDYSHIPLNLGGRINLLYCIFWGLLSVLWLRVLYPPMEKSIERMSPLAGKIVTWVLILLMTCNAALTSAAMLRYTQRQRGAAASGIVETYLDERYPDTLMEQRWPNMILTK